MSVLNIGLIFFSLTSTGGSETPSIANHFSGIFQYLFILQKTEQNPRYEQ